MANLAQALVGTDCQLDRQTERREVHLGAESQRAAEPSGKTIRNISATGLLIHSSKPIPVGESLRVDLPQGGTTEATVVWADGHLHGCEFVRPISSGTVSAAILKSAPVQPMVRAGFDTKPQGESDEIPELASRAKILIIVGLALLCWLPLLGLAAVFS